MSDYRELRDRDEAEAWLAAGLCLARLARASADEFVRISPWLLGALSEAGAIPPAGVIADIGHLLTGRSLGSARPLPAVHPTLRDAVSGYEDHVLGRLEADPRFDAVADAVARLPVERRDAAIALFCVHLLSRISYDAGVAIGPGVARSVLHMPVEELVSMGHAATTEADVVFDVLVAGYLGLITGSRRMGTLISEPEVFLIENFEALGELTHRLAIEQMIEVADALSASLPRRLKPHHRTDHGRIPTPLAAEDNYPTGGFSSLSTSGSMENLVVSELIYMEQEERGDIDLFDLRYAEGELLYYTRDESVFVRNRRITVFAFMPDLDQVRFKDTSLRWQRLVMALGVMACSIGRLVEWLEGEGLFFRAAFIRTSRRELQSGVHAGPDDRAAGANSPDHLPQHGPRRGRGGDSSELALSGERALCGVLLREWIGREMAEVIEVPELSGVLDQAVEDARTADTCIVIVSARPIDVEPIPGVLLGNLVLGEPEPSLHWAHRIEPAREQHGEKRVDLWQAWVRMTLTLLQEIL
ncbi:MAG: hypothetical protein MJE77_04435 [Proteobacteria bacterium]|nr:hypothetical protein [Pseudomonadota bacterium]